MKNKHLLLITYYWPPSNDVGTYRWLYFTRHLADLGWKITVFHPKNASYQLTDSRLNEQIHPDINLLSQPIFEPNQLLELFRSSSGKESSNPFEKTESVFQKWMLKVRANRFIPDARKLWIRPSVRKLKSFLQKQPVDLIVSNGPPHSCHLIGMELKENFPGIRWVADFRDPWQEIDYFDSLPLKDSSLQKHQELEQTVLTTADLVTTVSPSWKTLFEKKGAPNVQVYTNGFENAQFKQRKEKNEELQERIDDKNDLFVIRHLGTFNESRNPEQLWKYIEMLEKEDNYTIQIELIGTVSTSVKERIAGMESVKAIEPVSHQTAIELMETSDALLLCNNRSGENSGRIPAKFFEYIGAQRPILYLGQTKNDCADMINEEEIGVTLPYNSSVNAIHKAIKNIKQIKMPIHPLHEYSREEIAKNLHKTLKQLVQ